MESKQNKNKVSNYFIYPGLHYKSQNKFRRVNRLFSNPISIKDINDIVSKITDVSVEEMIGQNRKHKIMRARTAGQALSYHLLDASYHDIAMEYNKKEHSSVLHNVRKSDTSWLDNYALYRDIYYKALEKCIKLMKQNEQDTTDIQI
jgi:hypothetical protein